MAVNLSTKVALKLGGIVDSALSIVNSVRKTESARRESQFQQAVAEGGMSYQAQLEYREKQLKDEMASGSPDETFVNSLKESIASTKKLIRYDKYRTKYYQNYADMNAGRMTANEQLNFLNTQLSNTTDPDLKAEILEAIATTEKDVKNYENTITQNLITRAVNDKTVETIENAIDRVKSQKSVALLNDNEEEVTAYDTQLSYLKSQLSSVNIKDAMNRIEINTTLKGLNAISKLESISSQINRADDSSPITLNGVSYESEKDYWTKLRNNYLSGSGDGIFTNFANELKTDYDTQIADAVNRDGFVSNAVLTTIKSDFETLKSKSEVQPFINKISALESTVMGTAVEPALKKIVNNTILTGDVKEFQRADTYMKDYQSRYGVSTEDYRADLNTKMTNIAAQSENVDLLKATTGKQTEKEFKIPSPTEVAPTVTPATPAPETPITPTASNKVLGIGSQGEEVVKLQQSLGVNPDGIFGKNTEEAVKAFQSANNLTVDGLVGSITSAKLNEIKKDVTTQVKTEEPKPIAPVTPTPVIETPVIETPKKEETPVVPTEQKVQQKTHTVKSGETLSGIAQKYGVTSDKITGYKSGDPNKIKAGEVLTIL